VKKLGILVGEEIWTFFDEIYADLAAHYTTSVYIRKSYNLPLLYGRLNRWAFRQGIASMLRTNEVCFFEWSSELLMVASQMPKQCAIVTRLHSFELHTWAPKIDWDKVDIIILVSQAMQQKFIANYPEHSHKTRVVYNGRSLTQFGPPLARAFQFNLGMLCRITPIKRVYETILMLKTLQEHGYNPTLHIAGELADDLRYAEAVFSLVKKLALEENVIFHGHVTDTPAWLRQIDIFISNSYWEGQSVALLEAMASGCYCLSHHWAGADEMLPAENLYLTEAEMIQKIIKFAEMPDDEKRLRQGQLRSIACEKFDIEKTKRQIRTVIDEVGKNHTGG
jgi:glycosyltransferase involved in cell wall biosynthesis